MLNYQAFNDRLIAAVYTAYSSKGNYMKNRFKLFVGVTAMALSLSAFAKPALHTATIDQHGNIVAQSSPWIKSVSYATQKDYFATYKVLFNEGQFKKAPGFCSVSSIDTSDHERLFYGHAKLGGAATAEQVNVLGLMVGKRGASGDSSMSFQLACSN
ncbi:hypothetical protein ALQ51_02714 [Pseudomonas cannabina]|uniref:Uncharacterized protein n=4 Tax=Pseudomonas syringae group TaxID=136849 RepID=A0A3M3RAI7_PSECA|nr:hypothetical protein ALQ51_02714 [Pseudomonas cannabina]